MVHFDMTSIHVKPGEREDIMKEGMSGKNAIKMKRHGDGIGMLRIKQMMILNNGDFKPTFGEITEKRMGFEFSENKFELIFKKDLSN